MRKIALLCCLALLVTSSARSEFVDVGVWGGYSTLALDDANAAFVKLKNYFNNNGASATYTSINSGWILGGDLNFTVLPLLRIGPRLEYLQGNRGNFHVVYSGGTFDQNYDTSLTNGLLGLTVGGGLPLTGLSIFGSLYGGYGYGVLIQDATKNSSSVHTGNVATGGAFVGEASAKVRYDLPVPAVNLGLNLLVSYRMANLGPLMDGSKKTSDPYENVVNNNPNKDLGLDFSGLAVAGGLSLGF